MQLLFSAILAMLLLMWIGTVIGDIPQPSDFDAAKAVVWVAPSVD